MLSVTDHVSHVIKVPQRSCKEAAWLDSCPTLLVKGTNDSFTVIDQQYSLSAVYSLFQVLGNCYCRCASGCMQDGTVLWDAQSSKDCRVGLTMPREHADAIRCVDQMSCIVLRCWLLPMVRAYFVHAFIEPLVDDGQCPATMIRCSTAVHFTYHGICICIELTQVKLPTCHKSYSISAKQWT